jgi:hypothetical protein
MYWQFRERPPRRRMNAERKRQALALLLSLLLHALLLSLTFGDQDLGLPGFGFPWRERRIEAPDLRVVLMPAPAKAAEPAARSVKEPLQRAAIERPLAGMRAPTPTVSLAPNLSRLAEAIVPKPAPAPEAKPEPDVAAAALPAPAPLRSGGSSDAGPAANPEPVVIAVEQSDEATLVVPPPASAPTPVSAAAPGAASSETVIPPPQVVAEVTQKRAEPEVRERAVEVAKPDPSEREAQADQLKAAQAVAAQREAARQQSAHVEAARLEAERREAERREAARLAAAKVEAQRLEAVRVEAARQEAARQEAARVESARQEGDRLEAARQAATQQQAARMLAEQEEDARREARRRAMGRQLEEEAARREAASTAARSPTRLPLSLSTARRVRLWGRADPNVELVQYAEAWARKIQLNTAVDTVREVAKRPHTEPMVTVAIRSDGAVESVTFVLSSGVAAVDEAIRQIIQSQVPYQAFPPALAREYDVVEIRRTWHFDMAIQLY